MRIQNPTLEDIPTDFWQYSLAAAGEVVEGIDDIKQCLQILLSTQKGSIPLNPDLGVDIDAYIGQPVSESAGLRGEILNQIEIFEPRATVTNLTIDFQNAGAIIKINLTWESNLGEGTNSITYGNSA